MKQHPSLVVILALLGWSAAPASAQQSVTLTSTSDFRRGNNEGLASPAQDRVTRDRITAGTLGSWSPTTALPEARRDHSCVAHNGYIYVLGGVDPNVGPLNDVQFAPLNANGSVGAWSSTTSLPSERTDHASVAYNGYVYVIGGRDDFSPSADVWVAPLSANGSVGSWISTTDLPSGRTGLSCVAFNGFLYAIGGNDWSSVLSAVLVAPIRADGTLGGWTSTTALPSARWLSSAVAYNGFIYSLGGVLDDWSGTQDVFAAPLAANGSVGAWSSTSALPSSVGFLSAAVFNGFVYVIGGQDGVNPSSDVRMAAIEPNGTLGAWTSAGSLPTGMFDHASVAYEGYLYTTGGYDSDAATLETVYVAPINADNANDNQAPARLRAAHSLLVDLQADTSSRVIVINGQAAPGGLVRLRVRLAPDATKVFGAEIVFDPVPLGTPLQVQGSARYAWIRLVLDDSGTSDSDQPTFISDVTISVPSPPLGGAVNDGSGEDIDSQTSATTIEANWSGFVAGAGDSLDHYEWAIGTAPGLTNVQGWISVGLATGASNPALNMAPGFKYVSVRAISAAGLQSAVVTSDGVRVDSEDTTPPADDDSSKRGCGLGAAPGGSAAGVALVLILLAFTFLRHSRGLD